MEKPQWGREKADEEEKERSRREEEIGKEKVHQMSASQANESRTHPRYKGSEVLNDINMECLRCGDSDAIVGGTTAGLIDIVVFIQHTFHDLLQQDFTFFSFFFIGIAN